MSLSALPNFNTQLPDIPQEYPHGYRSEAEMIAGWLAEKSPKTRERYALDAKRLLRWLGKPLRAVTYFDLQRYKAELERAGYSQNSISTMVYAIKSLFTFVTDIGYLPKNPATRLKAKPDRSTTSKRMLGHNQIMMMILVEPSERNKAILKTLYGGGLRVSELCGLRWGDLKPRPDKDSGQVHVRGKGNKPREVLLWPEAWDAILDLYEGQRESDPIFLSEWGKPLERTMVFHIVSEAAERVGLTGVSPHWLRHSHATTALQNGCNLKIIQATLGHEEIATTGRYLHIMPDESSGLYLGGRM